MVYDLIVIGGGASGLCSAVYLKQICPRADILIIEALDRVGKKLSVTGNGRCNITNRNIAASRYHGTSSEFCLYALDKYGLEATQLFFGSIGVDIIFEGDRAFPSSLQAPSVVDCLRFAADELGIKTITGTRADDFYTNEKKYHIKCGSETFISRNLVLAAGALSGGERYGCTGNILDVLKKHGFSVIKPKPAIVQLKTETQTVRQLKGIKIEAKATLINWGKKMKSETGEILFCDYGLSGPAILQISRDACDVKGMSSEISIDMFPMLNYSDLSEILIKRRLKLLHRTTGEFFTGMLNKRIGQVILKSCGCRLGDRLDTLDSADLKKAASILKDWRFKVTGNTGFLNSQVTAGGVATYQFDEYSMESKKYSGLYAVGEILDIDGDCGGFNLQWAWSSAMCAADSIKRRVLDNDTNK